MNDRTKARRGNGAAAYPENGERREISFGNVFERLSFGIAKDGIADELGTSNAVLRNALALREMQMQAARRTQQLHDQAQQQLVSARSLAELTSVGLLLAQADAEAALRYWSDWTTIATRAGIDAWNEAFNAFARAQELVRACGRHWVDAAAAAKPETIEAQVEHATTPLTSSPLVWPAQEAVREAMTIGAQGWNDWLSSAMAASAQAATRH